MNMVKYKHWPRGEEETRLSAKQLSRQFDSGRGLSMKKIIKTGFIIVAISLFLVPALFESVQAQSFDFNKAYQDYQYNLTQYNQAFSNFQYSKGSYLANPTLSLKEQLRQSVLNLLTARSQLITVYLTMLRMKVVENQGLTNDDKNAIFSNIDQEIQWYNTDKDTYLSSDSLETLFKKNENSKDRFTNNTPDVINKTLNYISLGQESELRVKHEQVFSDIRSLIDTGIAQGKLSMAPFDHWLSDITATDQTLKQSEGMLREGIAKPSTKSTCDDCESILYSCTTSLSQFNGYLTEIVNYLKNQNQQ